MSTVPTLFRLLVDDAALFPPGNAPMARAIAEHRHHKASPYADFVGRFLCPASRLDELRAALADGPTLDLGVIADTGPGGLPEAVRSVRDDGRLRLTAVECAVPPSSDLVGSVSRVAESLAEAVGGTNDVHRFVEVPRSSGLDAVAALGSGHAKLRTGGVRADAFPSARELADFVTSCTGRDVPFKLTAGLHHAVRHTDPATGFAHHGFLNVLVAVEVAHWFRATGDAPGVPALIAERDPAPLVELVQRLFALSDGEDVFEVRAWFHSFGSCSVAEPLVDLVELGLLDRALLDHLPGAVPGVRPGPPEETA